MLSWLELGPDDLALGMLMLGQQGRGSSCSGASSSGKLRALAA